MAVTVRSAVDAFTTEPVTLAENETKLAQLPLHHNPGEHFTYSEGLDVLAYLVEVLSGMSFDQFLRQRLFDPLGMSDTWFYLPDDRAARLAPETLRIPTSTPRRAARAVEMFTKFAQPRKSTRIT